jgi:uncharacterized membrane protein YbhN (UPF0104 family)
MNALPHKTKQYAWFALKVFILAGTALYVYWKLASNTSLPFSQFLELVKRKPVLPLLVFLMLAALNWLGEIAKWQTIAASVQKITFSEATQQALAAHALSIATPNKIGEFGAKAHFFARGDRKKILVLTFFGQAAQLLVTLIFGSVGLVWVIANYNMPFSLSPIMGGALLLLLVGFLFFSLRTHLRKSWRNALQKLQVFLQQTTRRAGIKVLLLSSFRYACFSVLFWLLLQFFGAPVSFTLAWPLICAMYLLVSVVPSMIWVDVVVRVGAAVWLFSMIEIPEIAVLATVLSMWLLNTVLPALLGSFYVFTYRPQHI